MQKITFENARGEILHASRGYPVDFEGITVAAILENLTGVGAAASNGLTQRGFHQDGENFYGSLLEPRLISFDLWIRGSTRAELIDKRQKLMSVVNPKLGIGMLTYSNDSGTWQIGASVYDMPDNGGKGVRNPLVQKFSLGLYCPDPGWKNTFEYNARLIGFEQGFTLPFMFPFLLGNQGDTREFNYTGTLDAPIRIEFRGPAIMPKIVKSETSEKIEVEVELAVGESLFVDTNPNDIDVYTMSATGEKQSAFNYVKADSEYFQMTSGLNTLSFFAASGDPEAYVYWTDRFVGV